MSGGKLDAVLKALELGNYPRLREIQKTTAYDNSETKEGVAVAKQPKALYTVKEVAKLLRVAESSLRKMISQEEIAVVRIGGSVRISRKQLIDRFGFDPDNSETS
ncbi:MAG: helix-turn-helix domain-containing protein [Coriobacteriia bacterium]|nr:helix-turn-helix domain-containing protein [Coriobacteriia bacterium]